MLPLLHLALGLKRNLTDDQASTNTSQIPLRADRSGKVVGQHSVGCVADDEDKDSISGVLDRELPGRVFGADGGK